MVEIATAAPVGLGLLALIFGNGLLRQVANLFMRRFRWEPDPFVDEADAIRAGISHDYPTTRQVTQALVIAPQPWLRRLLYAVRGKPLPRRIVIGAPLFQGKSELKPGVAETFKGQLPATASVPSWNVFKSRVERPTTEIRLLFLVQVGRRRAKTRKLDFTRGVVDSRPLEATEQADQA